MGHPLDYNVLTIGKATKDFLGVFGRGPSIKGAAESQYGDVRMYGRSEGAV